MIALVTANSVVTIFNTLPTSFALPNGDVINAATAGWQSPDGTYRLVNVTPFVVPGGQQATGAPTYSVTNFACSQSYTTIAIPNNIAAQANYSAALNAGITLTWSVSTLLNGTYALDSVTQIRMLAERLSVAVNSTFTNGTTTLTWYQSNGTSVSLSTSQAGAFIKAVWQYLTAIWVAQNQQAAGGNPTWPSASVNVTG